MSDGKIVVAHDTNGRLKRAFPDLAEARKWNDAVSTNYTLTEVLYIDEVEE